jgi:hypothetical protein
MHPRETRSSELSAINIAHNSQWMACKLSCSEIGCKRAYNLDATVRADSRPRFFSTYEWL